MRFVCELCGARIDFPYLSRPSSRIEATGGAPPIRILSIGNREVHRCPAPSDAKR